MNKKFLKNVILERKYYYILIFFFSLKNKRKKEKEKRTDYGSKKIKEPLAKSRFELTGIFGVLS